MNILITNIWLDNYAGTEVGVRDIAIALHRRGVHVEVYSPELGTVAEEITDAGIHVVNSTENLIVKPDLIHGQHYMQTMDAMIKFPDVPAIYYLHDRAYPGDTPPKYSQIVKYVAVDYNCLDRLIIDNGIDEKDTSVLLNFTDTNRFKLRKSIAEKPRRALVFSNYAGRDNYYKTIYEACDRLGISLDGMGEGLKTANKNPENVLPRYDLVFAKAKAAMESLATGAGVITCDWRGLGKFITRENFNHFRRYNFGMKILTRPIEVDLLVEEIKKYNQADILQTASMIRAEASFSDYMDKLLGVYNDAIKKFHQRKDKTRNEEDIRTLNQYLAQKESDFRKKETRRTMELPLANKKPNSDQKKIMVSLKKEIDLMKKSWSYKIGRGITAPVRILFRLFK